MRARVLTSALFCSISVLSILLALYFTLNLNNSNKRIISTKDNYKSSIIRDTNKEIIGIMFKEE